MSAAWDAALTQLEALTLAMGTALLADDITTFARLVHGRGPVIEECLTAFAALDDAARGEAEERLRAVLAHDALLVSAGDDWLRATRARLIHLNKGMRAAARYGAPLRMQ